MSRYSSLAHRARRPAIGRRRHHRPAAAPARAGRRSRPPSSALWRSIRASTAWPRGCRTRTASCSRRVQTSQGQFQQTVNERLDAVTARLGETLTTSTNTTTEHLQNLHARLAVIDSAQKNITDLATQVTFAAKRSANKQRRGAFGQGRMEAIVSDGLPKGAYEFQFTLSNNTRPGLRDSLPTTGHLVIDAKFPLEAMTALARCEDRRRAQHAARQLRQDLGKHINDIAEKYLIPGETQDIALMFIPSESMLRRAV